jgi:VIT1/CCC1 family predicted Fe2+/Mn2+ transporter
MAKPIADKAEVALEYPDKLYVGTFERSSRFEAHLDPTGIALILEHPGAEDVRKSIHMHVNFGLFADILHELAATVSRIAKDDVMHRDQLAAAAAELHKALVRNPARKSD